MSSSVPGHHIFMSLCNMVLIHTSQVIQTNVEGLQIIAPVYVHCFTFFLGACEYIGIYEMSDRNSQISNKDLGQYINIKEDQVTHKNCIC